MNTWQRRILYGALAAMVITMLFPPWARFHPMGGITEWKGFGFIFSTPEYGASIVVPVLLALWAAIAIVCGILWRLKSSADIPAITALLEKVNGDPKIRTVIRAALDQMK